MSASSLSGRTIETFVADMMKSISDLSEVRLNEYNDTGDVYYRTNDGILRTLQVKKIGRRTRQRNAYGIADLDKYPDDMLIVAVNIEDKRCMLFKASEPNSKGIKALTITYDGQRKGNGYFNRFKIPWENLKEKLLEQCLDSTMID